MKLLAALLVFACACAAPGTPTANTRPNIVLILADDVGVEAFGCYGGTSYSTPRLDALAAGGVRFDHAYSQPLCTPSRVKLLTGKGNLRNYTHFSILDPGERTFADMAQEAGYATGVFGKWQLFGAEHYKEWAGRGTHPSDAGFDRWALWQVETLGSRYWDPRIDVDGELRDFPGRFGTDVFCDELLEFAAASANEPFLAYFPMALPHSPFVRTPDSGKRELTKQERFADMVAYMDAAVGRIEDGLAELGVLENTLLLFVGDNGTDRAIRSMQNGREIKGGKAHSTDAGTHVPMIISRPGTIAPGTCDDLVDLSDFWPTLSEAIGVSIEDGLDGRSFLPQLLGEPGDPRDVLTMYSNPRPPGTKRNPRVRFARDKRYKLYDDGRFFDTQADPDEARPLEHGQVTRVLREVRAGLQRALDAMPSEPAHLLP